MEGGQGGEGGKCKKTAIDVLGPFTVGYWKQSVVLYRRPGILRKLTLGNGRFS